MTERSAQPSAQRATTAATKPGAKPSGKPQSKPAADRGADETAVRPPLTERIQAKLSSARDEHVANAEPESKTKASKAAAGAKPPRRARLRLTRIDPWSVMKTAFLLSIAFGIVTVVSVLMVWSVLGAAGVWDSINQTIQESIGGPETANLDVENYVGTSRVLGFTMLVAAVDVILLTAIATLGAFLYNMAAALLGGIEVTLSEDN
ncbi:DUF3566 domain-containing protein [Nocardioides psychrotolerans]|uniref:DUF3566 domain-containing protein n=1 Tax=Nocardioides psychrotolerans TaxID=1005945 RepID=UPI003137B2BE